jgi:hypothetical protein
LKHAFSILVLAVTMAFATRALAAGEDDVKEIKPPFGLNWGETTERMERLLRGAKATIVDRRETEKDQEAWDVEGLVQQGLKRTVFYFHRGELVGVELQYQRDDWDEAKYGDFMGQVRRRIEQRYGPGQQIVRRTEPDGLAIETLVGYEWNLNNTSISLIYFGAKDDTNVFRTLSVHYMQF